MYTFLQEFPKYCHLTQPYHFLQKYYTSSMNKRYVIVRIKINFASFQTTIIFNYV